MRGIRVGSPARIELLRQVELQDPGLPGRGQIRVRLHASSLNYHDLGVVAGHMPTAADRIPMSDGAGVIEAVGEDVTEFAVGDSVVSTFSPTWITGNPTVPDFLTTPGDGTDGYAREIVVTHGSAFTHAPKGYSHAQAATLTTAGVTAWRALVVDGNLKAGETVLLLGTGGVSIFALQFAKAMGATVIITSSSEDKLERAKQLGADHVINYRKNPNWSAEVLRLTHGRGVDHVVEVGGAGTLPESIQAVRVGGHIALIGVLAGGAANLSSGIMMLRQIKLQSLIVGSRTHQQEMVRAIDAIGLKPIIDSTFPLERLADAFLLQLAGRHFGKIVVEF